MVYRYKESDTMLRALDKFTSEPGKHIAGNIIVQADAGTYEGE
jgi:hypothetical protein